KETPLPEIVKPEPLSQEEIEESRMEVEAKVRSSGWVWNGKNLGEMAGIVKWHIQLNAPKEQGERFDEKRIKANIKGILRGFVGERVSGATGFEQATTVFTTVPLEELHELHMTDLATLPGGPGKERMLLEASLESVSHISKERVEELIKSLNREYNKPDARTINVDWELVEKSFGYIKHLVNIYHTGQYRNEWQRKEENRGKRMPNLDELIEKEFEWMGGRYGISNPEVEQICRLYWEIVQGESDSGKGSNGEIGKFHAVTVNKGTPMGHMEIHEETYKGINYSASTSPDALVVDKKDIMGSVEVKSLTNIEVRKLADALKRGASTGGVLDGILWDEETNRPYFVAPNLEGSTYFVDTLRTHLQGHERLNEDQLIVLRFPADAPDEALGKLAERAVNGGFTRFVIQKLGFTADELNGIAQEYIRNNLDLIQKGDYKGLRLSKAEIAIFEDLANEPW
ncbi:MAG: hypothetical protein UU72_C0032G0018, partial [candidate division WWE3 bacterium GW2011_GWB1_41_6]